MQTENKFLLEEGQLPMYWYNIQADMPNPLKPPLHPGTHEPAGPEDLAPLFPKTLIEQEMTQERWIPIPKEVRDIYQLWRPTPLYRATRLEQALDTPAKIYYKYEGGSPPGSHKPNTAVAQAFYNKAEGINRITTETGAGQWGSALSFATQRLGMELDVYMVRISFDQKPYRKNLMWVWEGNVYPSPSNNTQSGQQILEKDPNSSGSLGIAISEAVEMAAQREDTHYALGSVLNHVLLHQTVVGLETKEQMNMAEVEPDTVIAPFGGGSNFGGFTFPFLHQNFAYDKGYRILAVEPSSCPTLTQGKFLYDYGDATGYTPLMAMHTLGHNFVPAPIHSGGLRYHGAAPLVSQLYKDQTIDAKALDQITCFRAGIQFAQTEGILPAPEANHGVAAAIQEAQAAKENGEQKTILFNLCGHGHFDMTAYDAFFNNRLGEHHFTEEDLATNLEALASHPRVD